MDEEMFEITSHNVFPDLPRTFLAYLSSIFAKSLLFLSTFSCHIFFFPFAFSLFFF